MFGKVLGAIATIVGAILCTYAWANYQLSVSGAISASAIQISQLANDATVNLLGGIGLMLFGAGLEITGYLGEIRDNLKKTAAPPASAPGAG